jgi:peptide/nickel transport system substrate-binding protein
MRRRDFLIGGAAALTSLAAPRQVRAARETTLKFIPQSDIAGMDPIWSSAQVTRNFAYTVFDTLFGLDNSFKPQPQMAEFAQPEDNFQRWTIKLRPGLLFHDKEPVLAKDCVASLARWMRRDTFGQSLADATEEMIAKDDQTITLRMKRPFPLVPDALAKSTANAPVMMPERLAKTDPYAQVPQIIGSGPFVLIENESIAGVRVVFAKNTSYRPRENGVPEWTSGPKIVNFDRLEWHIIPDASTAASALQTGEMDWWETPTSDYLDLLKSNKDCVVKLTDPTGSMATMRLNWLQPPFDKPEVRRLVLSAINQEDFLQALVGDDRKLYRTSVGIFPPGTTSASDAGMSGRPDKPDYERIKRELAPLYKGERVVVLGASDRVAVRAMGDVAADMFKKIGMNVDYQVTDWATANAKANRKDPVDKGGWSASFSIWSGLSVINPIVHQFLRSSGANALPGWPDSPRIEALRNDWLYAATPEKQSEVARQLQVQAFEDVPYVPLGQFFQPIACRKNITGILTGFPLFWNLKLN